MKPILHQAIHIKFKPSYLILGLLCAISMLCCWILLVLPMATTIKLLAILLVVMSSIYFILRDVLLMLPWSWQRLELDSKGQLTLINRRGQQFQPALAETTFIHAKLIILNFKPDSFKLPIPPVILLLTQENIDEKRRLRVWLRWAKHNTQYQDDLLVND